MKKAQDSDLDLVLQKMFYIICDTMINQIFLNIYSIYKVSDILINRCVNMASCYSPYTQTTAKSISDITVASLHIICHSQPRDLLPSYLQHQH